MLKTCVTCGTPFDGGKSALYCRDCYKERCRQRSANHNAILNAGKPYKIGSTCICEICGAVYIATANAQKYCPDCSSRGYPAAKRSKCGDTNDSTQATQRVRKSKAKPPLEHVCMICGNPYIAKTIRSKVCYSPECKKEYSRRLCQSNPDRFAAARRKNYQKRMENLRNMWGLNSPAPDAQDSVPNTVKALRLNAGISENAAAKLCGLPRAYYLSIERDHRYLANLLQSQASKLAAAFGISDAELSLLGGGVEFLPDRTTKRSDEK